MQLSRLSNLIASSIVFVSLIFVSNFAVADHWDSRHKDNSYCEEDRKYKSFYKNIWSQKKVKTELGPSEIVEIELNFKSPKHLKSASLVSSKKISPFIEIHPSEFMNIKRGELVNFTLKVIAPSNSIEDKLKGKIWLKAKKKRISNKLPVKALVKWDGSFEGNDNINISFNYPDYGKPSEVIVVEELSGDKIIITSIESSTGELVDELLIFSIDYTEGLDTWFLTNIDPDGLLLNSNVFSRRTLNNGLDVYLSDYENEIPEEFLEEFGPLSSAYAASPNGNKIYVINISQDSEAVLNAGYENISIYIENILESFEFN